MSFAGGRRYWECNLESLESNLSVYIGICKNQDPISLGELKETYGLLCPEGKKFSRKPDTGSYSMEKFAPTTKAGDTIGVLLEFNPDNGQGTLTFFINGGSVGQAFTDIKADEYYPCLSVNYGKNVVNLNASARMPSEPFRQYGEESERSHREEEEEHEGEESGME